MAEPHRPSCGRAGARFLGVPLAIAVAAIAVAAILAATASTPASAQRLTAAAAAQQVSETYGVEVLRVREVQHDDGRRAYAITVMAPGGNTNNAFQVTTLLIDARTGELIPQYRQTPTGQEFSGASSNVPRTEADGPALRRLSNRP